MADNKLVLPLVTRLKLLIIALVKSLILASDISIRCLYNLILCIKSSAPTTKLITTTVDATATTTQVSTSDVSIDPSRNLWFRLFVPSSPTHPTTTHPNKPLPFILYFHGGGFCLFGPDDIIYDAFCSRLAAETQSVIASINYRLAPEHRYPTQYQDAFDSLKFINSQNYAVLPANTDLKKFFIAGDSAGANIAHHLTVRACQNSHGLDKLKIAGLVSIQPFFGGQERAESELRLKTPPGLKLEDTDKMWRWFLPEGADRNHHAANVLNSTRVRNIEFPSCLVIVGGYDILQDWQRRYVSWLQEDGKEVELIEYPNAFHSFYWFPETHEYQLFIQNVRDFVQKKSPHTNSN